MSEVSIIMPAFNAEATIGQSIESIQEQTSQNWNLLVVDSGSGDQTAEIVKGYSDSDPHIKYLRPGNPAKHGLRLSLPETTAYVGFIIPGDRWTPEKLDTQLGQLRDSGAAGVFCNSDAAPGDLEGTTFSGEPGLLALLEKTRIETSAVLLHRDAYETGGGFPIARPEAASAFWLKLLHSENSLQGYPQKMVQRLQPDTRVDELETVLLRDIAALSTVNFLSGIAEDMRRDHVIKGYRELFDKLAAEGRKHAIRNHIPGLNATLGNPRIGSAIANLLFLPAGLFRRFSSWLLGSLMK